MTVIFQGERTGPIHASEAMESRWKELAVWLKDESVAREKRVVVWRSLGKFEKQQIEKHW